VSYKTWRDTIHTLAISLLFFKIKTASEIQENVPERTQFESYILPTFLTSLYCSLV